MLYPVLQDPLRPVVGSLFDRPVGVNIRQMLFGAGEQGGWYDVADMSTLFQDSAGATPVTAVEQPVGRMLDKSGRGNHATQSTTTKRPVLSRRVNLHIGSTSSSAVHPLYAAKQVVTTNAALTADGVLRATKAAPNTENSRHSGYTSIVINAPLKISVYAKPAGLNYIEFVEQGTNQFGICFNLVGSGSVSGVSGLCSLGNSSITALNDGWYFCETTLTGSVNNPAVGVSAVPSGTPGAYGQIFTGDGINGAYFYDFSIVNAIDAHLPYQHVAAYGIYDADPNKFPAYLRFDGVDDALQTGNIDFTSTDKMTVWAGVTRMGTAVAQNNVLELSPFGANPGTFSMYGRAGASDNFGYASTGTVTATVIVAADSIASGVLTGWSDIPGKSVALRFNSAAPVLSNTDQGAGTYAAHVLNIGARDQTYGFFNGRLYSLIVRGAQSSLSQIEATELYIKQKMRMP